MENDGEKKKKNGAEYIKVVDSKSRSIFIVRWKGGSQATFSGSIEIIKDGNSEVIEFTSSGKYSIDRIGSIPLDAFTIMEKRTGLDEISLDELIQGGKWLSESDILRNITSITNFGPAGGFEIMYKGKAFRLRPRPDEFLSPKPFQVWLLSEFGEYFHVPAKSHIWEDMITTIAKLSVSSPIIADDLAPPIFDDLLKIINRNQTMTEFTEDAFVDIEKGGATNFFLIDNTFYLHSQVYSDLMERHELSRRKMRQYFEPYLKQKDTKQIHQFGYHPRFWLIDWKALVHDFPTLASGDKTDNGEKTIKEQKPEIQSTLEPAKSQEDYERIVIHADNNVAWKKKDYYFHSQDIVDVPRELAEMLKKRNVAHSIGDAPQPRNIPKGGIL